MVERRRLNNLHRAALINIAAIATVIATVIGLWSSPAFALGGCTDSPENSSLILGLLGGAVAALPLIRARFKSRIRK